MSAATPEQAVETLNDLFKRDPGALRRLARARVGCNKALATHPTCQVQQVDDPVLLEVGMLGVLNAIFGCGADGRGYIAANYDDNGEFVGFVTLAPDEVGK